jgi:hypothetical protein
MRGRRCVRAPAQRQPKAGLHVRGRAVEKRTGITDVRTISVRGFADTFTGGNVDGDRMASAVSDNGPCAFELEPSGAKVPTPEMPAEGTARS